MKSEREAKSGTGIKEQEWREADIIDQFIIHNWLSYLQNR